jgi:hypothetical protein
MDSGQRQLLILMGLIGDWDYWWQAAETSYFIRGRGGGGKNEIA